MSEVTYYFNTGGVEWDAAELEAVLTQGESSHYWKGDASPTHYENGEGWEGWSELSYGDHYVMIDCVSHKIEVVTMHESRDWSYDAFIVFLLEGRYFRVDGEFQSYSGTTWNELTEVSKTTKTVTVWE